MDREELGWGVLIVGGAIVAALFAIDGLGVIDGILGFLTGR